MPLEPYCFGSFRLDIERGTLVDGTRELSLRKKLFNLLQVLLDRRDKLVPYEDLQERVWPEITVDPDNIEHFRRTVRQHATELRKILGAFGKCIVTLSGRGLRFSSDECTGIEREEGRAVSAKGAALSPTTGPDTSDIIAKVSSDIRRKRGLYPSTQESNKLYEQARQQWDTRNPIAIKESIRLYELAAQRDPEYALPLVGLAEAYIIAVAHGVIPPKVALSRAKVAAQQALEFNPNIGEPFASLAFIAVSFDKDWISAELWLKRALELSADYAFTYNALAYVSITRGNLSRAIAALDNAATLAPFSLPMRILQGDAYYLAGEVKKAVDICAGLAKESPKSVLAHVCLGLACTQAGDHKRAISEHEMAVRLGKGNPQYVGFLGFALAANGNIKKAKQKMDQLYQRAPKEYVPQYSLALLNIGIGNYNRALAHLEQGYANHDHWLSFALIDPKLDPLRNQERFQHLLARFKLPAEPGQVLT